MKRSIVHEMAFQFSVGVIELNREIGPSIHECIIRQLLKSGTAIGANISEAQESESLSDFIHKMSIALKECSEAIYWLELISDSGLHRSSRIDDLITKGKEIRLILRSIIMTSKKKRNR